ncbi:hypothetical protein [Acinetobacter sp. YH16032]|uniref:hypothetical protein n=1 Tax=Acinetobacter sp. YH16032 TaxID=2601181 RepID=UPI0015D1F4E9|nr:hypothetical protein [Acinetobacter sp. YH16032]
MAQLGALCISNLCATKPKIIEKNKFYITNDYFSNYDSVLEELNIEDYSIIKSMHLLDAFLKCMVGFFSYRVEGFSLFKIQGHIGILFNKDEIKCDNKNIFKIESVLNNLEYFLRKNILIKCENQYVREDDEIFDFPIKMNADLLDSFFIDFVHHHKIILPFYFSYGFIHFIELGEYIKIIDQSIAKNINPEIYKNLINYFRNKISEISDIKYRGI